MKYHLCLSTLTQRRARQHGSPQPGICTAICSNGMVSASWRKQADSHLVEAGYAELGLQEHVAQVFVGVACEQVCYGVPVCAPRATVCVGPLQGEQGLRAATESVHDGLHTVSPSARCPSAMNAVLQGSRQSLHVAQTVMANLAVHEQMVATAS